MYFRLSQHYSNINMHGIEVSCLKLANQVIGGVNINSQQIDAIRYWPVYQDFLVFKNQILGADENDREYFEKGRKRQ